MRYRKEEEEAEETWVECWSQASGNIIQPVKEERQRNGENSDQA